MKLAQVIVAACLTLGLVPGAFALDFFHFEAPKLPKDVLKEHREQRAKMSEEEKRGARLLRKAVDRDVKLARQATKKKEAKALRAKGHLTKIGAPNYSKARRASNEPTPQKKKKAKK